MHDKSSHQHGVCGDTGKSEWRRMMAFKIPYDKSDCTLFVFHLGGNSAFTLPVNKT
jgi:hypothetical protein